MSGERGKGLAAESPPAAQVPVPDFVGILGLVLVSLGQAPLPRGGQLSQSPGEGVLPVNRYRPIYRHSGGSRQRAMVVVTTGTTRGPDATVALGRGVQEPMSVGNWAKGGKRRGFFFSTFRETSYNGWGESGFRSRPFSPRAIPSV